MSPDKTLTKPNPQSDEQWKGYTLEDLQYRRAYVAARRELEKERLYHTLGSARQGAAATAGNAVRRMASSIPFVEYGIMAFSVGSKIFRFIGNFRKKKSK